MLRFIAKTGCFLFVLFVLLGLSLLFIRPCPDHNYLGNFFDKEKALQNRTDNCIIITGGSNAAFGFDSRYIEKATGKKVINVGLFAGLGLEFIVNHIADNARKGDIVLLTLEYAHFFNDLDQMEGGLASLFFQSPHTIAPYLKISQYPVIFQNTPAYIKELYEYNFIAMFHNVSSIYALGVCNENGDVVKHWEKPSIPYLHAKQFSNEINQKALKLYKTKIEQMRANGVIVFLLPPAIAETSFMNIGDQCQELAKELAENGVGYTVPIENYVYDDHLFFDSPYHLHKEGAVLRSEMVTKLLQSQLKTMSKTDER